MAQAAATDHYQPDEHPHHRDHAEVTPPRHVGERVAHQAIEPSRAQIAREQFQTRIRREGDVIEFQWQISIDTGLKIAFLRLTLSGLSVGEEGFGSRLLSTITEGLFHC